jgi:sugar phosphate permease
MAPALRSDYGLSYAETGLLISMSLIGSLISLIPWGIATDRLGERLVLFIGLAVCGVSLIGSAFVHSFGALAALLFVAGATGASVQSASGRAVMHWFPHGQRGLALGLRQTAIPISGFLIALTLPPVQHAGGVPWGFAAMGIACLVGALIGTIVLREGPVVEQPIESTRDPLRDPRLWTLSVGSSLVIAPQLCIISFTVLFLHARGVSASAAAAVLAVTQLLAVGARIGAGHWSDALGSRVVPLRRISLAVAVTAALTAVLVEAPLVVLVPVLVAAGVLSMSWNSLSFAAALEIAGHGRSGVAIGLQQTVLNLPGAAYPTLFGLVAESSWRLAFLGVAVFPLAGWRVLRPLAE